MEGNSSSSPTNVDLSIFPVGSSFKVRFSSASPYVLIVSLSTNRLNTLTRSFWTDCTALFQFIHKRTDIVRCVIITSDSEIFTAGLDLGQHSDLFTPSSDSTDPSRRAFSLHPFITAYQQSFSAIEAIPQPVMVAIHGPCIGGGIDLILSGDCRYCTQSSLSPTYFSIAEVNVGLAADVGTLQRIEKCTGSSSAVREWVYTGRRVLSEEVLRWGLVSQTFPSQMEMMSYVEKIAADIAAKSPVAVVGSKAMLNYSRDHSVRESLEVMALWNSVHLQAEDPMVAAMAAKAKKPPIFAKL